MDSLKETHARFMLVAVSLARRQLGQTAPNPNVGAVIVKDWQIIATGATAKGGRPHAETVAIENAGKMANDSTMYVTLEPCSHYGKTPPCVDAIISSGIKTAVIACQDKNPLVAGSGIKALRGAGIEVIENICTTEAREVMRGFFSVMEKKRPFISLKIATSLDGSITSPDRWLTGEHARNYGHLLRAQHDAIVTGVDTVLADDPMLTCRLLGMENRSPIRIVLDRSGRLGKNAKILSDQQISPTWVMKEKTIEELLKKLMERGITSLMVEAGAKLSTAFLESGAVDMVYWFKAPVEVGTNGLHINEIITKIGKMQLVEQKTLGIDSLSIYRNR